MVRSEVALWPLEEIGTVSDLAPVMMDLAGERIPAPPTELLINLADALLETAGSPPVVTGLVHWPALIVALWPQLWPEARRNFSGRAAMTPPQRGESVAPPLVYAIPASRALQWPGRTHITSSAPPSSPSRGAAWLAGQADAVMSELFAGCASHSADLAFAKKLARAADGLEQLRQEPGADSALALLRTLIAIAPGQGLAELKREALAVLQGQLANAGLMTVIGLANIKLSDIPEAATPSEALSAWVAAQAAQLGDEDAERLLEKVGRDDANAPEAWWRGSVRQALVTGIQQRSADWGRALLRWLAAPKPAGLLDALLPDSPTSEDWLLLLADNLRVSMDHLDTFREHCRKRGWSRLHAWGVSTAFHGEASIDSQLAFVGDPLPGLAYLVERLPGQLVVSKAVAAANSGLTTLAGKRTAREPNWLEGLDASHAGWRALWRAHLEASGVHWPQEVDRNQLAGQLLDAVLAGDPSDPLIATLATDLAATALEHPQRAQLWKRLGTTGKKALLSAVAATLLQRISAGLATPTPETELAEAVIHQVRSGRPTAIIITALLGWDAPLAEQEVVRWISSTQGSEWLSVAEEVGHHVQRRGWGQVASEMYSLCRWSKRELRPAVAACVGLLSRWEQNLFLMLYAPTGQKKHLDQETLARYVAEIGADIAPDQALDYWERAGGERKWISHTSRPDAQWRDVANRARHGGNARGLTALIRELRKDYPNNDTLQELSRILK
ncbi:MAG: hypothetical protein B7Y41_08775 [Hydrogenophilales bacterium 28-61-23]|nr:MAG: hypothetical protein B7Y41_08775 [Hydrogenophilales bacterium 28-61-23]